MAHIGFWIIDSSFLIKLLCGCTMSIWCKNNSIVKENKVILSSKMWQEPKTVILCQLKAMYKLLSDCSSLWLIHAALSTCGRWLLNMLPFYLRPSWAKNPRFWWARPKWAPAGVTHNKLYSKVLCDRKQLKLKSEWKLDF